MNAHRRAVRANTCMSASASFVRGFAQPMNCIVTDLSATGAGVVFLANVSIPRYLNLTFSRDGQSYRAQTMWQQANKVGVMFLPARVNAPEVLAD